VVAGGNPAATFPDRQRIVEGLRALDLLVTIDPFPTETARLADYVIAPAMSLERPEDTRGYEQFFSEPFAQYSAPLLERPGDVVEDWEFFFELASAMGLLLNIGARVWEPGDARPTSDELLESFAGRAQVPYADVRAAPHGAIHRTVAPTRIGPPRGDATARFELLAPDVARELHEALDAAAQSRTTAPRPFLLTVRRSRHAMNSLGRRLPQPEPVNPCWMHPDDLAALPAVDGELVTIASDHGSITAVVAADPTLRPGVVAMTHAHGGLPGDDDDPVRFGANPAPLLSLTDHAQPVSLMPWMTAVPVSCTRAG
jgi:anaerobic selenocysteine-containing dehydrogenase